ncbi:MAG: sugar phosphate isomerase/epimerase family protein [Planctomycetaceae bacterium]
MSDSVSPADSQANVDRRRFLSATLAGAGAVAGGLFPHRSAPAASPVVRTGGSHMKLSIAAYSFNRLLPTRKPLSEFQSAKMTLDDVVEFAAKQDLDGVELTSYYFPTDLDSKYLMHLKEMTFRLGLDISGTAIGNDFCLPSGEARNENLALTRRWIDNAAAIGAPVIRIFAGTTPEDDSEEAAVARCIEGINESLDYAAEKGVVLALENHGGITSTPEQLLKIVHGVKESPWFGVNFDSGNFYTADPYADLEKIAPYTVNAQIKVSVSPDKKKAPADFGRIVNILRTAGYRGYLVLEYEEDEDPLTTIPGVLKQLRELIS